MKIHFSLIKVALALSITLHAAVIVMLLHNKPVNNESLQQKPHIKGRPLVSLNTIKPPSITKQKISQPSHSNSTEQVLKKVVKKTSRKPIDENHQALKEIAKKISKTVKTRTTVKNKAHPKPSPPTNNAASIHKTTPIYKTTPPQIKKVVPLEKAIVKVNKTHRIPETIPQQTSIENHSPIPMLINSGMANELAAYKEKIVALIEAQKTYPRRLIKMRREGSVTIEFTLSPRGELSDIKIVSKSGHHLFAQASLKAIDAVKDFPHFPKTLGEQQKTFVIAMNYNLTK